MQMYFLNQHRYSLFQNAFSIPNKAPQIYAPWFISPPKTPCKDV